MHVLLTCKNEVDQIKNEGVPEWGLVGVERWDLDLTESVFEPDVPCDR